MYEEVKAQRDTIKDLERQVAKSK